ncbi:portal_PBSX, phage portal protein, PBSX family [uncultured Caudovirales phage]|uniref:Portal_PBSX, phage portal protein, PBSX family n=1 Tax=uncultured Caudovirales phage TaxID=2100421 RepID=A0A6J5N666_9CAUD|nr:portal_PBSX, phage portal protein, PBSX family [uncultured Caudovirales phage]
MKKIQAFELNNYVRPDERIVLTNTGKYLTHGRDNSYYQYVEERYIGSPTNNAVIDAYCSYIYGEGLQANIDINSIISKNDVRLAIKDLKMHGQYTLQVVYTKDRKNIAKLYHIPVKQIAVDRPLDITDPIENFWYSFDWRYQTKYRPALVPAFGTTSGKETEIAFVRTPSCEPIYSLPDYQSALQYCDLEEELSNFYNCHVKNKFSAGTIININQGFDTPEEQEEAERSILAKTTGTSNAGTVIISVNDNKENATTVEQIVIADAYNQYEWLSTEARDKILMAHKVVNPILFGIKDGGGLGNNADEMTVALKTLYRSQIKPFREIFIDGLENILSYGGTTPELYFKDFEELVVKEQPAAVPVVEQVAMSKEEFDEWTTGEIKMTKEENFDEWVQLKKWRESVDSSNVRQVFYNDTLKEMVIQFNSGRFYTYFQVEMSLFQSIVDGKAECLTTGTSIWGSWNKGDTPSVGAAVHQLLTGIRYQRGGRAWT